jgi:hypothetical protein
MSGVQWVPLTDAVYSHDLQNEMFGMARTVRASHHSCQRHVACGMAHQVLEFACKFMRSSKPPNFTLRHLSALHPKQHPR